MRIVYGYSKLTSRMVKPRWMYFENANILARKRSFITSHHSFHFTAASTKAKMADDVRDSSPVFRGQISIGHVSKCALVRDNTHWDGKFEAATTFGLGTRH